MSVYLILLKLQNLFRLHYSMCARAFIHHKMRHFDSMGGIKINNKDRLKPAQHKITAEKKLNKSNDSRR